MRKTRSILPLGACAVLAALAWIVLRTHSAGPALAGTDTQSAGALSPPSAEQLSALDAASASEPRIDTPQSTSARAALEVRTIQTAGASVQVQPPKAANENCGMILVWCYVAPAQRSIEPDEIVLVAADGKQTRHGREKEQDTFRGLAPGVYSVIVHDARFAELRVDDVCPGSHVLVDLFGRARVRPHAIDAENGAEIAPNTLRLVGYGRGGDLAPDAQGWFCGLPGGDLDLTCSASGYEDARLELTKLGSDEAREVDLRFSRAGEIRGIVVGAASGLALAGVRVNLNLLRGEEGSESEWRLRFGLDAGKRFPHPPVFSDRLGHFAFSNLPCGRYRVEAQDGALLRAPPQEVELVAGARERQLTLALPSACALSGTLAGTGGVSGLQVELVPRGHVEGSHARAAVQSDGHFEFEEVLPTGPLSVLLVYVPPGREIRVRTRAPSAHLLGELDLQVGTNTCSFAVAGLMPGSCRVEVASGTDSQPPQKLLVAAREGATDFDEFPCEGNTALVGPLLAGDYLVLAEGPAQSWCAAHPQPLHIEPGANNSARIELQLVRGRILLLDEEGDPLEGGTRVQLGFRLDGWPDGARAISATSGTDGALELLLEPGSYTVQPLFLANFRGACTLEWTAAGAAQRVLRLPAPR